MSADTKILQQFYACINSGDIRSMLQYLDPEVVRVEPEGFPTSGTYRGHAEVLPQFTQARSTWAEGACTPEKFFADGDKIVVGVHVHVRLKDKTDWIDARIADGFVVRNGKILEFRTFFNTQEALDWAGIKLSET